MQISNLLFKTFFPRKQYKCQARKKGIKIKLTDVSSDDAADAGQGEKEKRCGVGSPPGVFGDP